MKAIRIRTISPGIDATPAPLLRAPTENLRHAPRTEAAF